MHFSQLFVTLICASNALGYAGFADPAFEAKYLAIKGHGRTLRNPQDRVVLIGERRRRQIVGAAGATDANATDNVTTNAGTTNTGASGNGAADTGAADAEVDGVDTKVDSADTKVDGADVEVDGADAEVEDGTDGENVLIGDLVTGITTPEGQKIADLLLDNKNTKEENFEVGTPPSFQDHTGCSTSTDPCCKWYFISKELNGAFLAADGQCTALARQSVRMGFHDAGTWSSKLAAAGQDHGGADGSLVLFGELSRPENFGLEGAAGLAEQLYHKYGVSMADLIQYMANHAAVSCPLGPRVRTYVGRKDATKAAPDGLLPSVHAPADDLIALFADKTISAHDLTALLGAHSTSTQRSVDSSKAGYPQDSTPGVWDVKYYNETLEAHENDCIFKFESDVKLSKHASMAAEWQKFVGDQSHWNEDYARAYLRLSLLGVNNINDLKECTLTLPSVVETVPKDSDVTGKCQKPSSSSTPSYNSTSKTPNAPNSHPTGYANSRYPAASPSSKDTPTSKPGYNAKPTSTEPASIPKGSAAGYNPKPPSTKPTSTYKAGPAAPYNTPPPRKNPTSTSRKNIPTAKPAPPHYQHGHGHNHAHAYPTKKPATAPTRSTSSKYAAKPSSSSRACIQSSSARGYGYGYGKPASSAAACSASSTKVKAKATPKPKSYY